MAGKKKNVFFNRYFINACFLLLFSPLCTLHSKVPSTERAIPVKNPFGPQHGYLGSAAVFPAQLTRLWLLGEQQLTLNHTSSELVSLAQKQ